MAERRKNKKKKEAEGKDIEEKPSKEEYAVARYLKQKLPEKKTTLLGHKVEYFIACKAVDCLAESPWAQENKKGPLNFNNRDIAINFMARLLEHKFFHRAKKIVVQKDPKKKKKEVEEKEDVAQDSGKEKESKKSKGKSDTAEKTEDKQEKTDDKKEKTDDKKEKTDDKKGKIDDKKGKTDDKKGKKEAKEEKKKEKKKIKLDMHLEQLFIDSNEPYVWIYDPIPLRTWITGTLMVIAAVALCLFPLWPQTIRHYIYYLSVAAAFFLVFIIGLAVLRLVVFVILWVLTFGKHHLWLLPNLTEDVGFFESFWPLYKYEYKGAKDKEKSKDDAPSQEEKEAAEDKTEEKEEKKEDEDSKDESDAEEHDQNLSDTEQRKSDDDTPKTDNGFEFLEVEEMSEEEEVDNKKSK